MVEGIRVPILVDTGAEVSVLSTEFVQRLFPEQDIPSGTRQVRALGGQLLTLKGPLKLKVEVSGLLLEHPFYYYDKNTTFLMGFDLISAAALVIDPVNRCVWSKITASTPPAPKQSTHFNASVPPLPSLLPAAENFDSDDSDSDASPPRTPPSPPPPSPVSPSADPLHSGVVRRRSLSVSSSGNCHCVPVRHTATQHHQPPASLTATHVPLQCSQQRTSSVVSYALDPAAPIFTPHSAQSQPSVIHSHPPCTPSTNFLDHSPPQTTVHTANDTSDDSETFVKAATDTEIELPEHVNILFLQTVEQNNLSSDVSHGLVELLKDHSDTFAKSSTDLGYCDLLEHDIDTGDSPPIRQSPRRPPLAARDAEDAILDEMLESGVIEPSNSSWASPVCLVRKKDGTFRFCVDYRRVNAVSKKDAYPVPDIQDALDHLRGAKYFATFDLLSGYWQLGLTERAKERSAFCTRRGLYHFTRMPFGLCGAPSTFCRLMHNVLRDLLWRICLCYLDDIIIYARTPQELLQRLRQVLDRLRDVGLKVKPTKCALFQQEVHFLGHQVSCHGIEPLPDKIQTIKEWPVPHCIRDVRAFFGLASYYRKFVRNFASIAEPLSRLTKKSAKFEWTDEAQEAFESLKRALIDVTSLAFPYPDRPCVLDTDASDVAIGAVLSQNIDGVEKPIAFFSRVLNPTQRNYCTTRRELLAVICALQHFRHYLLNQKVILRTDHYSLMWLKTFKRPEGILARWVETLAEFDVDIEHRPGRLHNNVDGVSRPFCKQCTGKTFKTPWVDELERADELTEPLSAHVITMVPEISQEDMATLQAEDPTLGKILQWLEEEEQPSYDELRSQPLEVRNLWAQRPQVYVLEGLLVRQFEETSPVQLVIPAAIRRRLVEHTHGGPLSAHLGPARVTLQLKQAYYWPGMSRDVTQWCHECRECAKSKTQPTRPKGKLQKVITGAPMDIVAIDILSGLPVTPEGYKYILVVSDYFTKYSRAFPLVDAEASTCMRAIYDGFFALFGLPRQIHSDQGKNFESKLFQELCDLSGVQKSHTTAFHPQCDGQVERLNRTLLQMLRTTVQDNPHSWPQRLETLMAAYRMTVHKVTGVTPNMAMLGREVLFPATLIARPPEEASRTAVPFVSNLRDTLREAHERVRQATQSTARTQKRYYDKRSAGHSFREGQKVWLFWPKPKQRQKFHKLVQQWDGPWTILKFKSSVVVEIHHFLQLTLEW